ncbi:MAG: GGDEF domain-containing protein [Woeseiaceae bacterium]
MKPRKLTLEELPPILLALCGIAGVGPMGVFRLIEGNYTIAFIDGLACLAFGAIAWVVYRMRAVRMGSVCIAMVAIITATLTVSIRGGDHVMWMYPATIAMFYLLRPREAAMVSIIAISIVLPSIFDGDNTGQIAMLAASLSVTLCLSVAFATLTAKQRLHLKATTLLDPLTGAGNRRALDNDLDQAIQDAESSGDPFVLIMLDIDHFKTVNDLHGHSIGDAVLCAIADTLKTHIRPTDACFRAGGEEFVVLAMMSTLDQGQKLAERLRIEIANVSHPVMNGEEDLNVTASFGIAEHKRRETRDSLYKRADDALYEAKRSGRNRLHLADRTLSLSGTASYVTLPELSDEDATDDSFSEAS